MNFLRRTSPVHVRPEGVFGLRRSLNTPVVSIPDFPTGPAEGAILVHRELRGRLALTLGVRSSRGGETALWDYEGRLEGGGTVDVAVDAALSFAEGMGFLFDDDELRGGSEQERQRARYLWEELMGTGEVSGLANSRAGEPEPELLLEDEADDDPTWSEDELVLVSEDEVEAENTGPLVDVAEAVESSVQLSKFRTASPAPSDSARRATEDPRPAEVQPATPDANGASSPEGGLSAQALADWDDPGSGVEIRRPAGKRRTVDLADVTQPDSSGASKPVSSGASPAGSGQPRPPLRDVKPPREEGGAKARGRAALGRLKLIKRRPSQDGEERRGWLQRVLAAF
jgi:hypothetical protein